MSGVGGVDAIVLTGGASRRLGRPKTVELVGGRPILARVTGALTRVERVIIVGPAEGAVRADVVCREDPPGAGPLAALATGLGEVTAGQVVLLAGDLPFVTRCAIDQLVAGLGEGDDVAVGVDDHDNDQYLLALWRTASLREALSSPSIGGRESLAGGRLRDVYRWAAGAQVTRVKLAGDPPPWWDCDTAAELEQARRWLCGPGDEVDPDTPVLVEHLGLGALQGPPELDDVAD